MEGIKRMFTYRTVAPALIWYVMTEFTNGITVAARHVRNSQCRQTASLDFTVWQWEEKKVVKKIIVSN